MKTVKAFGKKLGLIALALSFSSLGHSIAFAQASAQPQSLDIQAGGEYCVISKVEGDKVPFPLHNANTKFALADGETYILNGTIVSSQGKFFFKVDFVSQPWLATATRVAHPFYSIDPASSTVVKKFENGEMIQIAVVTHKAATDTGLIFKLILPPVALKR